MNDPSIPILNTEEPIVVPTLCQATEIGQLVKASSQASRYVCVALSKTLNMAIRITPENTLSVRVEASTGGTLLKHKGVLEQLLIPIHDNGLYASAHVKAESALKACMGAAAYVQAMVFLVKAKGMTMEDIIGLPGKGV